MKKSAQCQTTEQCKHEIEWDSSIYDSDKKFNKIFIAGQCIKCNAVFEKHFTCDMFVETDDNNKIKGHWLSDFEVGKESWE